MRCLLLLPLLLVLYSCSSSTETDTPATSGNIDLGNTSQIVITSRTGTDHALFFAVDDYANSDEFDDLPDPIASAEELSRELEEMYGFRTEIVRNPSKEEIYKKLQTYRQRTFGKDDQLLVFFSGHGDFDEFEVKGYFIPQSGPRIDLPTLGNIVTKIPCEHILLAIDACYSGTIDNRIAFKGKFSRPGMTAESERSRLVERKLRNPSRLLLTSGAKQRTPSGNNGSPFARGFLRTLRASYGSGDGLVTYEDLLARLERVSPLPHHGQLTGHEEGSFVFVVQGEVVITQPQEEVIASDELVPIDAGLAPNAGDGMVLVKGGTFQMGDQFGVGNTTEKPMHTVTVADFYLGRTEIMMSEFADFIEATNYTTTAEEKGSSSVYTNNWVEKNGVTWRDNTAGDSRPNSEYNHPVIHVSWYDAVAYCNWLSSQHGLDPVYQVSGTTVIPNWNANGYRLPTEAEWEYAARSGGKKEKWAGTSVESSLSQFANYSGNLNGYKRTAPVGVLQANNLGLADMSGNVWEWCWDWYDDNYFKKSPAINPRGPDSDTWRVIRGGSWSRYSSYCRAARRNFSIPTYRSNDIGFRLARSR